VLFDIDLVLGCKSTLSSYLRLLTGVVSIVASGDCLSKGSNDCPNAIDIPDRLSSWMPGRIDNFEQDSLGWIIQTNNSFDKLK
jgi:hypothetical protein